MFVAGSKAIVYVDKLKKDLKGSDADEYLLGCDLASFFDLLCCSLETELGNAVRDSATAEITKSITERTANV